MAYNIVTNFKIINEFKKRSRYFKINLGIVNTVDKNGNRVLNDKDNFANFYNTSYKATIYRLLISFIKISLSAIFMRKKSFLVYKYRIYGLLNAYLGKSSWLRPEMIILKNDN